MVKTDYLEIDAGAMGMAFTDVLKTESETTVTVVARYHQPGGHWNIAYPFVRLHQPSTFYGANSREPGRDRNDTIGWNKGLYELAGWSYPGASSSPMPSIISAWQLSGSCKIGILVTRLFPRRPLPPSTSTGSEDQTRTDYRR